MKAGDIGATNTQYHPPVCQELACSRLAILYHTIASKSASCLTLAQGRMELDIAYLRCTPTVYRAV
jgi:hypothetical protein